LPIRAGGRSFRTLDTYYLGLDRKTAAFNRGVGQEVRYSIGARLSRPVALSTVRSDCFDGARDGHTQCRCPETRNPGPDDNGPDTNDHRHRRGLFARERQQPEIAETGCGGRRNVLGRGVGSSRHTLLDLGGPVACDRNLRRVQRRVASLPAHAR
jgi:hypothetical protein